MIKSIEMIRNNSTDEFLFSYLTIYLIALFLINCAGFP